MGIFVFGADGGGTRTLGLISTPDGNVVARRTTGPSNPNVVGFDLAAKTLYDLIADCCKDAGCFPHDLGPVVLGIAGAGREDARQQLTEKIGALAGPGLRITIVTDARIALEGAFEGAPGVVIIAGTGSVVIGKNAQGITETIGGWGRAFGDEGSGFFLGLEALKVLRLYYDGRGGSELLAGLIGKEFALDSRERILAAVYQHHLEFSKIAPLVLIAAEQRDPVALRILETGASELTEQARTLVQRLKVAGTVNMAFLGGLMETNNVYFKMLCSKVSGEIPSSKIRPPVRLPAEGAVLMAIAQMK